MLRSDGHDTNADQSHPWTMPVFTLSVSVDGVPVDAWRHQIETGPRDDVDGAVEAMTAAIDERSAELRRLRSDGADVELHVFGYVGDGSRLPFTPEQIARLARAGAQLRLTASTSER